MKVFHSTRNLHEILENGFKIPKFNRYTVGRLGNGIYFGATINKANEFGDKNSIVVADIDYSKILKFNYLELLNWFPERNLSVEDYEGVIELKEFILSKGYLGCHIIYEDSEIVVYDTSIILDVQFVYDLSFCYMEP